MIRAGAKEYGSAVREKAHTVVKNQRLGERMDSIKIVVRNLVIHHLPYHGACWNVSW